MYDKIHYNKKNNNKKINKMLPCGIKKKKAVVSLEQGCSKNTLTIHFSLLYLYEVSQIAHPLLPHFSGMRRGSDRNW